MGWKNWPSWLKGGIIGLIGFIILFNIIYFTIGFGYIGVEAYFDNLINNHFYIWWMIGFIIVGAILKSIFNRK